MAYDLISNQKFTLSEKEDKVLDEMCDILLDIANGMEEDIEIEVIDKWRHSQIYSYSPDDLFNFRQMIVLCFWSGAFRKTLIGKEELEREVK